MRTILVGLLVVFIDVRIGVVDILPDFIGFILIVVALVRLAPAAAIFRKAKIVALLLVLLSLPEAINLTLNDAAAGLKIQQLIAYASGDMSLLLPERVGNAVLVRITRAPGAFKSMVANPIDERDRVMVEYSDGTVIMALRYKDGERALAALRMKAETDYSLTTIRKRLAEKDPAFNSMSVSEHRSSAGNDYQSLWNMGIRLNIGERELHLYWQKGLEWWDPQSWNNKGGLGSNTLYIVEGNRATANDFLKTLNGEVAGRSYRLLSLLPLAIDLLMLVLVWLLCSGLLAITGDDFATTIKRLRLAYIVLSVPSLLPHLSINFFPAATGPVSLAACAALLWLIKKSTARMSSV